MIVAGIMSTYAEGELVESAIRSLRPACDFVLVLEGPSGDAKDKPPPDLRLGPSLRKDQWLTVRTGAFDSDASKRTELVRWAEKRQADWAVSLDGDEVLLWGEYLRDWIRRGALADNATGGGFAMRIVELDGSTSLTYSRILKPSAIDRYLLSSNQVLLKGHSTPIAWPNVQVTYINGIPVNNTSAACRLPLQGEPHILHRTALRDPARSIERQHVPEGEWFEQRKPFVPSEAQEAP